jgi:hypothetical protein
VPLAVLTADVAKSPVVGAIVVPGLTWLLALVGWRTLGRHRPTGLQALRVLGACLLVAGACTYAGSLMTRTRDHVARRQAEVLVGVYDSVERYARTAGWTRFKVLSTALGEEFWPPTLAVMFYERHGWLPDLEMLGYTLLAPTREEMLERVAASDVVLLVGPTPHPVIFPFDAAMREMHPMLTTVCERDLVLLGGASVAGRDLRAYVRAAVRVDGLSGGWISADGLTLRAPGDQLAARPEIHVQGKWAPEWLGRVPRACATLDVAGRPRREVPAAVRVDGSSYDLRIDLAPQHLDPGQEASVHLRFDGHFVPRELGINDDPRRLVVGEPTRVDLRQRKEPAPEASPCPFAPAPAGGSLPAP